MPKCSPKRRPLKENNLAFLYQFQSLADEKQPRLSSFAFFTVTGKKKLKKKKSIANKQVLAFLTINVRNKKTQGEK